MKKIKSVLLSAAALTLVAPLFAVSANAADWPVNGSTPVTYDNSNSIPDPDNPGNPQYSLNIPSSIVFTDTAKSVKADVTLKKATTDVGAYPAFGIDVTVASTNAFKLKMGNDELDYALVYDGKSMNATDNTVGSFAANLTSDTTIQGTANLIGTATKTGTYTDTLTYTFTKKTN